MSEITRNRLETTLQKHTEADDQNKRRGLEKFDKELKPRLEKGVNEIQKNPLFKFIETLSVDIKSFISKQERLSPEEAELGKTTPYFLYYPYSDGPALFALSPQGWLGRSLKKGRLYPIQETILDCLGFLHEKWRGEIAEPGDLLKSSFKEIGRVLFGYNSALFSYQHPEKGWRFEIGYKNFTPNYGIGGPYGKPNVYISFHGLNSISSNETTPEKLEEFLLGVAKTLKNDRPYLEDVKKRTEEKLLKQAQIRIPRDLPYPQVPIDLTGYALGQIGQELRALRGEKPESIT